VPFHSRISSCPAHSGRSVANYEGQTGASGGHRHSHQKCCLGRAEHLLRKQVLYPVLKPYLCLVIGVSFLSEKQIPQVNDYSILGEAMSKPILVDTAGPIASSGDDRPWTVRQAAQFLGVSPQSVYLWVERKQIPHLRVMGRNIRFLRSDLETFRASFRQGVERD